MGQSLVAKGIVDVPFGGGQLKASLIDIDGPASYATGGQEVTARSLGLKQIVWAGSMTGDDATHFTLVRKAAKKNVTSVKVVWYVSATGAELAAAQNVSARFTTLLVIGF